MADHSNENLPARVPEEGDGQAVTQNGQPLGMAPRTPSFASLDEANEGIPWDRYLAALKRYKWLILTVTALGTAGAVVASRFIKPEYTVTATIWIQAPPERAGVQPGGLLKSLAWQELLGTNVVLDSVALKLGLYLTPSVPADSAIFSKFAMFDRVTPGKYHLAVSPEGQSYVLLSTADDTLESGEVGDSIGRHLGFLWAPDESLLAAGRKIDFTVVTPRDASSKLRKQMSSNMARNGTFLRLQLLGEDPQRLARILNAITEQFVSVAAEQKARKLSLQARTLETQLEIASVNLDAAETSLQQYRIQTITLPSERTRGGLAAGLAETQRPVIDRFFERKMEQEELRQSISALETTIAGFQVGGLGASALLALNVTAYSPDLKASLEELATAETELRDLRRRFTDEAPLVMATQQRIAYLTEVAIPQYSDRLLQALRDQETRLTVQIDAQAKELQEIPVRTITEQRLTREKVAAEKLVEMLQNSHEETKLALSSTIPDVRQLDPAVAPTRPSSNDAPTIILGGFVASLVLALALAVLLDKMDKRFRYPEQATDELGLSILGAIPAIRKLKSGHRSPKEASQVIEAFRTVRLALSHSYGAAGPIMFTVSSPGPGDGKSLVSSNLALSFAEAGYSTLLIDGDIRRGELHRMFDIDRQPGLLDFLTGDTDLDTILRKAQSGLSVVPCGTRRPLGPELLSSPAMGDLMATFKTRFDVIILDSPPLGAGIDPFILSTTTGNLLMVLRAGETDRKMAEEKLKLVDRLPIRVLGALLNDVHTTDGAYRYYNYVYDYHPEDDQIVSLPASAGNERA